MWPRFGFAVAIIILTGSLMPAQALRDHKLADSSMPRLDSYGDPLPQGAIRRLGTVRFRGGAYLSPDGVLLAFDDGGGIVRLCEFTTGKELLRVGQGDGRDSFGCFSPDSKRLATIGAHGRIQFWDVATGKPLNQLTGHGDAIDQLRKEYAAGDFEPKNAVKTLTLGCAFWPDGNTLASYGADATLRLWDVRAGKEIARHRMEGFEFWNTCSFLPSGKILARFRPGEGSKSSSYEVELWDTQAGKLIRSLPRMRSPIRRCEFTQDMRAVALVTDRSIHFVEVASGRESHTMKRGDKDWWQPIAFSPDGKMLASIRDGSPQLWDALTGKELRQLEGKVSGILVPSLFFTPDQKTLVVQEISAVRFWDLTTGLERQTYTGHLAAVEHLAFSQDGKTLLSIGGDCTIRLWDVNAGRQLSMVQDHDWGSDLGVASVSRDLKTLASSQGVRATGAIRTWDLSAGLRLHKFPLEVFPMGGPPVALAFTPGGKILATAGEATSAGGGGFGRGEPQIRLRDVSSGSVVRWMPVKTFGIDSLAFSPNGKMLASAHMQIWHNDEPAHIKVWNLASGEPLFDLPFPTRERFEVAFSPDGKILATWDQRKILLWELATRQVAWEFKAPKKRSFQSVQFLSGARILAISHRGIFSGMDDEHTVRVWDVWERKELFAGEEANYPGCATLSPDGALLASASFNTSILLWQLPIPRKASSKVPSTKDLHRFWADLAGPDVPAAYQAIRALAASPEQSVSFLKTSLRPASDPRISRLIANLDDDEFHVREAASRDLARLGEDAEPALRQAATSGSQEVRRRAERLLQHVKEHPEPGPDQLRILRAIQVLEQVGNHDAIQILQELARGGPEARLTQEAKASLERLTQRSQSKH